MRVAQADGQANGAWAGAAASPWQLSQAAGDAAIDTLVARGLPRLAAQFGPALLDKAVADAALRAAGQGWCDGVREGVLGDPWSRHLTITPAQQVTLRHTVGLADRLTPQDQGADPQDGLPATLQDAIHHYGLHHFKLKLSGGAVPDLPRLRPVNIQADEKFSYGKKIALGVGMRSAKYPHVLLTDADCSMSTTHPTPMPDGLDQALAQAVGR